MVGLLGSRSNFVNQKSKIVNQEREGMGVEPTAAGSAPPATNFEDWGAHRDTSPPAVYCTGLAGGEQKGGGETVGQ